MIRGICRTLIDWFLSWTYCQMWLPDITSDDAVVLLGLRFLYTAVILLGFVVILWWLGCAIEYRIDITQVLMMIQWVLGTWSDYRMGGARYVHAWCETMSSKPWNSWRFYNSCHSLLYVHWSFAVRLYGGEMNDVYFLLPRAYGYLGPSKWRDFESVQC